MHSGIDSDHYPLKIKLCINLKAKYEKLEKIAYEYTKCDEEQKLKYNEQIKK